MAARLPPFPTEEFVLPTVILAALSVAEYVTAAIDPRAGLPLHAALIAALISLGATTTSGARRELFWTLALAPVIRLGSLTLPLGRFPVIYWYPIIGLPIFASAIIAARQLGYRPSQIGLTVRFEDLHRQFLVIPLGMVLGIGEYLIFRPAPLIEHFTFGDVWLPSVILVVFTGFEEELIFRGLMQRAALRSLGRWGLVYVNLVFAAMHIGYLSTLDLLFVFLVGLLFSLFVLKTRSILGVTIAHGAINTMLFLVVPFLAPLVLGSGYADLLPLPPPSSLPKS